MKPILHPTNPHQQSHTLFSLKCGLSSFLATYIAGIMHPLDIIKTRYQSHDGKLSSLENQVPKYESIYGGLRRIYREEGLRGLYKGFYISIVSQAMATAFFFLLYQRRKIYYLEKGEKTMNAVSYASIEASIIATVVTQPLWVIKTRMLLNVQPGLGEMQHMVMKSREIYQQSGLRGFAKGLGISVVLSFNGVLQMYIYQGSKILYTNLQIPQSPLSQKSFLCGSLSKLITILFTYPLTTIRTRIQQNQYFNNRTQAKYSNVLDIVKRMGREQGLRGFYKGLVANLLKGMPQRGIYFYCYQGIKGVICRDGVHLS